MIDRTAIFMNSESSRHNSGKRDRKCRKLARVWNVAYINPANWSCWMLRGLKINVSDAHALEEKDDNDESSDNVEWWFESDVSIATRCQTRHLSLVLRISRWDTVPLLWKYYISDVAALFCRRKDNRSLNGRTSHNRSCSHDYLVSKLQGILFRWNL